MPLHCQSGHFSNKSLSKESIYNKLNDIQQTFETFYTNLYTQPKTDGGVMEAFLNSIKLPEVRDEQNKSLIGEITEGEIKKAISHFKTNKASGPN